MIFKALIQGFRSTWQYLRIVGLLYVLVFLVAALVAYPFQQLLQSTVGHSLMVGDLLKGFDYTFLNDFKNAYGEGFLPIINQSIVAIGVFLLLFIFLTGGLVATLLHRPAPYDKGLFWGQSAHFFWRIFRLSLYFILLQGGLLAAYLSIFYQSTSGLSLFEMHCETTISYSFLILTPIYLLIVAFFFLWQDISKIILVQTDKTWIFQSLWASIKLLRKHFFQLLGLYLINALLWLGLILLNVWLSTSISFEATSAIFYSFLLSQLFVLARLGLKIVNLGSLTAYYQLVNEKG